MSKIKGTKAERELINMFWENGWAAIRSAGSGSMHFPSPDILAGNKLRRLAIEVKTTKEEKKYFPEEEVKQLINFSSYFGAEPWFAIKFNNKEWAFITPDSLKKAKNALYFEKNLPFLSFEELIAIY